jgi:hypothetical protein
MRSRRRILVLAAVLAAASFAFATAAPADQAFHTLRAPLSAVGNAPLRSGWIADIHANGPIIGAHEEYHLNGGSPSTTYQVVIQFYPGVTGCPSGSAVALPTAQLTTNAAGNGNADWVFPGGPPGPVTQNSAIWELVGPDGVAYQTDCQLVLIGA